MFYRQATRRAGVAVATLAFVLVAAPVASAAPASNELGARIDQVFAKWDKKDSAGVIVAVAKDGQTIHARGYGMANLKHGIPLTADTISESGSVAKQFTAAAVVLLDARGQLSLDDPIQKHLPEMKTFGHPITLRQILSHTSGLGEKDRAFAALEIARSARDSSVAWLRNDYYLRPLHSDPRWPELLRKVGLADDQLK